jgi:hypothetical protein
MAMTQGITSKSFEVPADESHQDGDPYELPVGGAHRPAAAARKRTVSQAEIANQSPLAVPARPVPSRGRR